MKNGERGKEGARKAGSQGTEVARKRERGRERRVITGSHCHGSRCRLETSDSASPKERASRSAVSSYPRF